jgi:hypothetical protein
MQIIRQSAHDRLVREMADRYIRQGCLVQIAPLNADLPEFLRGLQPDMIVTSPEGHFVVNVKARDAVWSEEYWEKLKNTVDAHPGWHYTLVLNNRREEELFTAEQPVLSAEEIEQRLMASQQLADNGLLDSALVIAWSAVEAALWKSSRRQGLQVPNQGPGPLITVLYSEGNLSRKDYDALMSILKARIQAARGFKFEPIDRSVIDQVQQIMRRLMKQKRRAA